MNKIDITIIITSVILIWINMAASQTYKEQWYCEYLYMSNQVELMREEACSIEETAARINKVKSGR